MPKQVTYLSNDYCFAYYVDGQVAAYGTHGDDPTFALEALLQALELPPLQFGSLRDLDGGAPTGLAQDVEGELHVAE